MPDTDTLFIIHFAATAVMAGLIWTIQLLHYPFFHHLGKENFAEHMEQHRTKISFIVVPVMLLELFTAAVLALTATPFQLLFVTGLILLICIWASTFFIQMPGHNRLTAGYSKSEVDKLVKYNWIRTSLWSLRLIFLVYLSIQFSFLDSL